MNVKELKELLNNFDENMEVRLAVYSGPTKIETIEEEDIVTVGESTIEYYQYLDANNYCKPLQTKRVLMITGEETE